MKRKISQILPKTQYDQKEWEEPLKGTKWSREDRTRKLKELGLEIGLFNLHRGALAKMLGVSRRTLYDDIQRIYASGVDRKALDYGTVDLNNLLDKSIREIHDVLNKGNPMERLRAANAAASIVQSKTDFMERYGFKDIISPIEDSKIEITFKEPEWLVEGRKNAKNGKRK